MGSHAAGVGRATNTSGAACSAVSSWLKGLVSWRVRERPSLRQVLEVEGGDSGNGQTAPGRRCSCDGGGVSVSTRVSPVELVVVKPLAHITVARVSCPAVTRGATSQGSCLLRLALSASSPGDFRPVGFKRCCWVRLLVRSTQEEPWFHRSGPSHCAHLRCGCLHHSSMTSGRARGWKPWSDGLYAACVLLGFTACLGRFSRLSPTRAALARPCSNSRLQVPTEPTKYMKDLKAINML